MPVDHVELPVADLDASRRFYTGTPAALGYRLVYEGPSSLDPDGHNIEAVWHGYPGLH